MKLPAWIENSSLMARLSVVFSLLTLVESYFLYMCVATAPILFLILLLLATGSTALFLCVKNCKICRITARIGLVFPPLFAAISVALCLYTVLPSYGYSVTLLKALSLITLFLESTVLFATPACALLSVQGYRIDRIIFRVMAVINVLLAGFTVWFLGTLQNEENAHLLLTFINAPAFSTIFVISAAATALVSFGAPHRNAEK